MKKFFSAFVAFGISYGVCTAATSTQSKGIGRVEKESSVVEKMLCSNVAKAVSENKD